jgi:hypothetical protein
MPSEIDLFQTSIKALTIQASMTYSKRRQRHMSVQAESVTDAASYREIVSLTTATAAKVNRSSEKCHDVHLLMPE